MEDDLMLAVFDALIDSSINLSDALNLHTHGKIASIGQPVGRSLEIIMEDGRVFQLQAVQAGVIL